MLHRCDTEHLSAAS